MMEVSELERITMTATEVFRCHWCRERRRSRLQEWIVDCAEAKPILSLAVDVQ